MRHAEFEKQSKFYSSLYKKHLVDAHSDIEAGEFFKSSNSYMRIFD